MVQFIKQEAEEKANEIRVAAEEVRAPPPLPNASRAFLKLCFVPSCPQKKTVV
jgi:hypothetical protein